MAFPDTWMQAWLWLEFAGNVAQQPSDVYFTSSAYWYALQSGTVPTSTTDQRDLCSNVANQLWFAMSFGSVPLLNSVVRVYVNSPGNNFAFSVPFTNGINDFTGYMPSYYNVVLQRFASASGRAGQGRVYIPAPPQIYVGSDFYLIPPSNQYVDVCTQLQAQVFGATGSWVPAIASYKSSLLSPIILMQATQRLSILRHRTKARVYRNSQWNFPKPPPP